MKLLAFSARAVARNDGSSSGSQNVLHLILGYKSSVLAGKGPSRGKFPCKVNARKRRIPTIVGQMFKKRSTWIAWWWWRYAKYVARHFGIWRLQFSYIFNSKYNSQMKRKLLYFSMSANIAKIFFVKVVVTSSFYQLETDDV